MSLLLICSWICLDCLLWFDLSGYLRLSDRFCLTLCGLETWVLLPLNTTSNNYNPFPSTMSPKRSENFNLFYYSKTSDLITSSIRSTTTQKLTGSKGVHGASPVLCLPRVPGEIKLYALVQIFLLCGFLYAAASCSFLAATCYHGNSNFWQHFR